MRRAKKLIYFKDFQKNVCKTQRILDEITHFFKYLDTRTKYSNTHRLQPKKDATFGPFQQFLKNFYIKKFAL